MNAVKETTLHPDGNDGVDLYPKTNINQVEGLKEKIGIYDNYQDRIINLENYDITLNNTKLNKPITPTAESAVTMLADGTVGTKPLSEIGGGGKLYRHHISFDVQFDNNSYPKINGTIFIDIYSSSSTAITLNTIPQLESGNAYIAYLYNLGYGTQGVVGVKFDPAHNEVEVYGAGSTSSLNVQPLYYYFPYPNVNRFVDDYTEI